MKRSLINTPHGSRARHTPYRWKSHEDANSRGYESVENNSYQRFSTSSGPQPCGDNFIPLNVSTPVVYRGKHNANRYSTSGRNNTSSSSGWYNSKNNYHTTPKFNSNNRYPAYNPGKQLYGQKKGYTHKGIHQQPDISAYVDMDSFLEDPWKELIEKFNSDSEDIRKSEMLKNEPLSNPKLTNSDFLKKLDSKLEENTNLNNSQKSKSESSVDTNVENTDINQISQINSLTDLDTDVRFNQNLRDESICSTNDENCGAIQEKNNTDLNALTDTDKKNI